MPTYLLDTCILIDYFKGHPGAVSFLEALNTPPFLSTLTLSELYAGVREGRERQLLDGLIRHFTVIPLEINTAIKGGLYKRQYAKSHGVGLVDALIAACAEEKGLVVATRNIKHFPTLKTICPY